MTYTLDTTTAAKKAGIKSQRELAKLIGVKPYVISRLKRPFKYTKIAKSGIVSPRVGKWLKTAYLIADMIDVPFVEVVDIDAAGNYSLNIDKIKTRYIVKHEVLITNDQVKSIPTKPLSWIKLLYRLCITLDCDVKDIIIIIK